MTHLVLVVAVVPDVQDGVDVAELACVAVQLELALLIHVLLIQRVVRVRACNGKSITEGLLNSHSHEL